MGEEHSARILAVLPALLLSRTDVPGYHPRPDAGGFRATGR
jgi:hypothetical protein